MRRISSTEFYLNNIFWIFFCLGVAGVCVIVTDAMKRVRLREGNNAAVRGIVKIRELQNQYFVKHRGRYAPSFDELVEAQGLEAEFRGENPVIKGYVFTMSVEEPTSRKPSFYMVTVSPLVTQDPNRQEERHFYTDSTLGTVRVTSEDRPATADDPTI